MACINIKHYQTDTIVESFRRISEVALNDTRPYLYPEAVTSLVQVSSVRTTIAQTRINVYYLLLRTKEGVREQSSTTLLSCATPITSAIHWTHY